MKYRDALESLTQGMTTLDPAEVAHINNEVPTIGARLRHLPFWRLRHSSTHRFGSLRAYLKVKSFDALVGW